MYAPGMPTEVELIAAIDAGDLARVSAILAEDDTLANARGEDGVSALLHARYRNHREIVDRLLAADPHLDVFDAAALGHIDRLRLRLEEDPDRASVFAPDGFTALHLAAFFGKAEAARVLLQAGASATTYSHNTFANQPLHAAAAGRHVEVCRVLLAGGADVDAAQHAGFTPLHQAADHGDVEMVELFLSAGADPRAVNDAGETPADTAMAAGHADLATRLREKAGEPT